MGTPTSLPAGVWGTCNEMSEEEGMEVYSGEEISGNRSLEISQYYSINRGVRESCGHKSQDTSHSTLSNNGGH